MDCDLTCPVCEKEYRLFPIDFFASPYPFCSDRCRLIDQGLIRRVNASTPIPEEKLPLPQTPDPVYGYAWLEEELKSVNNCADEMVYYDGDIEGIIDREPTILSPPSSSYNGANMSNLLDIEMPKAIRHAVIQTDSIMRRDTQRGTNCSDGSKQAIGHFLTNLRRNIDRIHNDAADYDVKRFIVKQLCKQGQWVAPGEIVSGFSIDRYTPGIHSISPSQIQMWAMNANSALSDDEEAEAEINAALDGVAQQIPIVDMQFASLDATDKELNIVLDELCELLDDDEDVLPIVEASIIR